MALLDHSVQMQLIRRGGIKGGPRITTEEDANGKIEALRKHHAEEEAAKRAKKAGEEAPQADAHPAGQCRTGGITMGLQWPGSPTVGEPANWTPPPAELTDFGPTQLEEGLKH